MSSAETTVAEVDPTAVSLTDHTAQPVHDTAPDDPTDTLSTVPIPPSSPSPPPPPPSLPASVFAHMWWLGSVVVYGLEYVGEALADLLGITSSPYQYVIDAKERQERWQKIEEEEEETARVKFEEELRQQQNSESSRLEEGHTTASAETEASAIEESALSSPLAQPTTQVS